MKLKYSNIISIAAATVLLSATASCKKNEPENSDINFSVSAGIDAENFSFDSVIYTHPAGYVYGVNKVQFYISAVELENQNGETFKSNQVTYLDLRKPEFTGFSFNQIPNDVYTKLRFLIGIDSATNKTGALPATVENINMAWPDGMGGGYHFLKLEGYYKDSTGLHGYAMHLGTNKTLVKVEVNLDNLNISKNTGINLQMNIAEWFKNPELYDFNVDGNYSMGKIPAMMKLSKNGVDVFTTYH